MLTTCPATGIDIRKEGTLQHGGTRMPSITKVSADYESGVITLQVTGYTGNIQIYVNDKDGNIVGYTQDTASDKCIVTLSIEPVAGDFYSLDLVLDNSIYHGKFYVEI